MVPGVQHDPIDTEAAERAKAEQAKRDRNAQEIARARLRKVLSGEHGRSFVMDIIERAGVFRLSFQVDQPEQTHLTAFSEGRRNEGLRLLTEILESCPEFWPTMLNERAARLKQEAQ